MEKNDLEQIHEGNLTMLSDTIQNKETTEDPITRKKLIVLCNLVLLYYSDPEGFKEYCEAVVKQLETLGMKPKE